MFFVLWCGAGVALATAHALHVKSVLVPAGMVTLGTTPAAIALHSRFAAAWLRMTCSFRAFLSACVGRCRLVGALEVLW